jgi:hypothetical protein
MMAIPRNGEAFPTSRHHTKRRFCKAIFKYCLIAVSWGKTAQKSVPEGTPKEKNQEKEKNPKKIKNKA